MLPGSIHTESKEPWPYNAEQPWGQLWLSGLTRLWLCHTGDYQTLSNIESHGHVPAHTQRHSHQAHTCTAICYCHKLLYARFLQHTKIKPSKEEGRGRMLCEQHSLIRSLLKNRFSFPISWELPLWIKDKQIIRKEKKGGGAWQWNSLRETDEAEKRQ